MARAASLSRVICHRDPFYRVVLAGNRAQHPLHRAPVMLRLIAAPFLAFAGLTTAGCLDGSSTNPQGSYPTLLTVDSATFRGALPCGAPGLATYVVTLTDVSIKGHLTLPSSVPVACESVISFSRPNGALGDQYIVAGHFYIALIDGYDRVDIAPADTGSRDMIDPSGTVVAPRWMTTCGEVPPSRPNPSDDGDASLADAPLPYNPLRFPTLVLSTAEVVMRGCLPLAGSPLPDAAAADSGPDHQADAAEDAETGTNATVDSSIDDAPDGVSDGGPDNGPEDVDGG
jgi:hypothetical protein